MMMLRAILLLSLLSLGACAEQPVADRVSNAVTIHRDDFGVPHIYATSEAAGYYGLGYAQAQDQLETMLGLLRWAEGRVAELMGDSALGVDIEMRRWRHRQEAEQGFASMPAQLQKNYRAFAAGVHAFMQARPDAVPPWGEPPRAEQFVALSRAAFWAGYIARLGPAECVNGGASLGRDQVAALASLHRMSGMHASNGWALMPKRSSDGSTWLLADPHVEVNHSMYYEYRLHAGELHSAGFAMGPLLWQAHNRHVGWAMTTGNPDLWDCYAVALDPTAPNHYRYDDDRIAFTTVRETIRSRSGKVLEKTFRYSHHNGLLSPVVAAEPERVFVVSASPMHDAGKFDTEIWRMQHAHSVDGVQRAMQSLGMFPQNVIVADTGGEVWYVRAGKTPRRPAGDYDWHGAVPGNTAATAWQGYHALEDMVQTRNPPEGWIQNNNVSPQQMYPTQRMHASDYAPELFNDRPDRTTTRGMRAIEVLSQAEGFGYDEAVALAFDERWVTVPTWQRALRAALAAMPIKSSGLSADAQKIKQRILDFDGVAAKDSVAALSMLFWYGVVADDILQRDSLAAYRTQPWPETPLDITLLHAMLEGLEAAARAQRAAVGSLDATLGNYIVGGRNKLQPLGGVALVPASRHDCISDYRELCDATLRAFWAAPATQGPRPVLRGSQSMRLMKLSPDGAASWTLKAWGASAREESPHYDDQARLASEHRLKPARFTTPELTPHITATTTLEVPADF